MKKLGKLTAILLAGALSVSALTACGGGAGGGTGGNNANKTEIKFQIYDCGFGQEFAEQTAAAFEDAVKDKSYEDGKTGVHVEIEAISNNATGESLVNGLRSNPNHVYFTEFTFPLLLKNSNNVMDISSWLNETSQTEGASQFAEATSIKDRMFEVWRDYNFEPDGSAYSVPMFMSNEIITYDQQLVEEKKLYIADTSTDVKLDLVKNSSQNKQKGVDGIAGTEDDGLPETYAQLYLWFDEMLKHGVTPLSWSGAFGYHFDWALQQFWADFEGKDNVMHCYTFDGSTDSTLIEVDNAGNITHLEPTAITLDNGYMVQKQEGRYRALSVAKKIAENNARWVYNLSFSPSEDHLDSQTSYLASKFVGKPIMCFAHGAYWEAEATATFESYASQGGGKSDRKLAVLPTPKATRDLVGTTKTTVVSDSSTALFVKKGLTGATLDAVKDFVMFFNTQPMMALQNRLSATPRPFNYDISTEEAKMTNYEKSVYNFFKQSASRDVVYTVARSDFYMANYEDLSKYEWILSSRYDTSTSNISDVSVKTFRDNPSLTLTQYFNGLYINFAADNAAKWQTMLSRIDR